LFHQLDAIDAHLNKTPPQQRSVIYFDSAQRAQQSLEIKATQLPVHHFVILGHDVQKN